MRPHVSDRHLATQAGSVAVPRLRSARPVSVGAHGRVKQGDIISVTVKMFFFDALREKNQISYEYAFKFGLKKCSDSETP